MNLYPYTDFHELNDDWIIGHIKKNEKDIAAIQNTIVNLNFEFDRKADKATTYTKSEVNSLLSTKANVTDLPDMSNYYDKSETNTLLNAKADISSLATVATSGSYNDLLNKPTIPAAQVNSDWDASSGVAQILNKPDLSFAINPADITFTPESAFTVDRFYVRKQLNIYTIVLQVTYTGPTTGDVKVGTISGIPTNVVPVYSPVIANSNDDLIGGGAYTNGNVWIKLSTTSYTKLGLYFTVIR